MHVQLWLKYLAGKYGGPVSLKVGSRWRATHLTKALPNCLLVSTLSHMLKTLRERDNPLSAGNDGAWGHGSPIYDTRSAFRMSCSEWLTRGYAGNLG